MARTAFSLAETGSPLVFVTHYPSVKRPFYAMDHPENPRYTLSYDLLLHGLEITTGGQRIHDYEQQVAKMKKRHMNPADFENYLTMHKYGLPPHGGFGLGMGARGRKAPRTGKHPRSGGIPA